MPAAILARICRPGWYCFEPWARSGKLCGHDAAKRQVYIPLGGALALLVAGHCPRSHGRAGRLTFLLLQPLLPGLVDGLVQLEGDEVDVLAVVEGLEEGAGRGRVAGAE